MDLLSDKPLEIQRGINFGPVEITATDAAGAVVPLAGWAARAQVRKSTDGPLIVDFRPAIELGDTIGLITLPEISWETTAGLPLGDFTWDLILCDPTGRRMLGVRSAKLKISAINTQD